MLEVSLAVVNRKSKTTDTSKEQLHCFTTLDTSPTKSKYADDLDRGWRFQPVEGARPTIHEERRLRSNEFLFEVRITALRGLLVW